MQYISQQSRAALSWPTGDHGKVDVRESSNEPKNDIQRELKRATEHINSGKFDEAIEIYENLQYMAETFSLVDDS